MIEIILTVCAIANPANCEEKYLQFAWDGSLNQCMMAAQPYIAQWIGQHPHGSPRNGACDYPGNEKAKDLIFGPRQVRVAAGNIGAVGFHSQFGPKATPQGSSPT